MDPNETRQRELASAILARPRTITSADSDDPSARYDLLDSATELARLVQARGATERHRNYTNYATFGVAVTLDNDRVLAKGTKILTWGAIDGAPEHENVRDGTWTVEEAERFTLATMLKDRVERLVERGTRDGDAGLMASQMAQAGLCEVDWDDLARTYINLARTEWERDAVKED